MNYLSVCSGIEAATVAWHPLDWSPVAFAEIEKFPSAVLRHHYPRVPNHGDFTTIEAHHYGAIDLLVGGTPCQDFSVAGLRAGMDGKRGQLTIEFARLAERTRPRWLVWENVPGVLSIDRGRAFGTFLGLLGQLGYGFAYRILDAQFFGVPQRRRRVFVVGHLGDWRRAAAVLFERHSLSGHPAPRREAGQDVAGTIASSTGERGYPEGDRGGLVSHISNPINAKGGQGRYNVDECLIPSTGDTSHRLTAANAGVMPTVAFTQNQAGDVLSGELMHSLGTNQNATGRNAVNVQSGMAVRRLTPRECERLQGFPDDYTKISDKTADGPRYKALGNSMAVPVMAWIGARIEAVERIA